VQRSFDDLGTPLADVTFCVLDLETTGGNRVEDTITEVGAVKVRGGEFLGTFQTLVNPGRAIPPQITMLTGLTDALVGRPPASRPCSPRSSSSCAARSSSGTTSVSTWRSCAPPSSAPVTHGSTRARRHRRPGPAPRARRGARLPAGHLGDAVPPRPQADPPALDDALATTDLLHLLIERASGLGVLASTT
jgi:DNA polymerase-3 subunit epsilon